MSVLDRLNEPSTHAGIGSIFAGLATMFPQYSQYLVAAAGIFGAIAAIKKDPATPPAQ